MKMWMKSMNLLITYFVFYCSTDLNICKPKKVIS